MHSAFAARMALAKGKHGKKTGKKGKPTLNGTSVKVLSRQTKI